jgi:3-deoxy-manno-octulosonate cytidylyltransferase (CMP-KDO synthetase)
MLFFLILNFLTLSMSILGVIPARFASTRFPAKALADINGKSMVQRVYEQVAKATSISKVVVATDHQTIFDHVKSFGGEVTMTSVDHQSGTDRCAEVSKRFPEYNYIVNIQGDEPFIDPEQIKTIVSLLDGKTELATLAIPIKEEEILFSPNSVKLIFDKDGKAIYFSRNPIPFIRNYEKNEWILRGRFFKHIGMYAYRSDILKLITSLPQSSLEISESLEQLRWIENGFQIKVSVTNIDSLGIDTPEDLQRAKELYF